MQFKFRLADSNQEISAKVGRKFFWFLQRIKCFLFYFFFCMFLSRQFLLFNELTSVVTRERLVSILLLCYFPVFFFSWVKEPPLFVKTINEISYHRFIVVSIWTTSYLFDASATKVCPKNYLAILVVSLNTITTNEELPSNVVKSRNYEFVCVCVCAEF